MHEASERQLQGGPFCLSVVRVLAANLRRSSPFAVVNLCSQSRRRNSREGWKH